MLSGRLSRRVPFVISNKSEFKNKKTFWRKQIYPHYKRKVKILFIHQLVFRLLSHLFWLKVKPTSYSPNLKEFLSIYYFSELYQNEKSTQINFHQLNLNKRKGFCVCVCYFFVVGCWKIYFDDKFQKWSLSQDGSKGFNKIWVESP